MLSWKLFVTIILSIPTLNPSIHTNVATRIRDIASRIAQPERRYEIEVLFIEVTEPDGTKHTEK